MPARSSWAPRTPLLAARIHIAGGSFDLAGFNQTLGNITFGDGSSTTADSLIDSGATKGTLTLNGDIRSTVECLYHSPRHAFANLSLAAGTHNITKPNGYSSGYYDLVISGVLSGAGGLNINTGPFNVALTSVNTYTGPTVVTTGVLYLAATNVLSVTGVTVNAGGNLFLAPVASQAGVTPGNYNQSIGSLAGGGAVLYTSAPPR